MSRGNPKRLSKASHNGASRSSGTGFIPGNRAGGSGPSTKEPKKYDRRWGFELDSTTHSIAVFAIQANELMQSLAEDFGVHMTLDDAMDFLENDT